MLSYYRHCLDLRETKNADKSLSKIMTEVETKKTKQRNRTNFKKRMKMKRTATDPRGGRKFRNVMNHLVWKLTGIRKLELICVCPG